MISLKEYNPFFMKRTYNLPDYKPKYKKRVVIEYDPLFYAIFNKIHNQDITHIDYSKINEQQEKTKLAVFIEQMKMKPKEKEGIIENLMYEKKITFKTFHALCLYYKINVLYVKDNIFIKFFNDNQNDTDYLTMDERFLFVEPIDFTNKYEINIDKPLKCESYYKIDELRKISELLHLPNEKMKKKQLYESISNVLNKYI
jgi:hypothetical protein